MGWDGISANVTYGLGLDFGTSGARAVAIDPQGQVVAQTQVRYDDSNAAANVDPWQQALAEVMAGLPRTVRQQAIALACNGTSGTVLLCDGQGQPLTPPLLYNDDRARDEVAAIAPLVPEDSAARSASASLPKLYWWRRHLPTPQWQAARYVQHQADWLAYQFHGRLGISDYHNALKLGYDVGPLAYPPTLRSQPEARLLPQVRAPGADLGPITAVAAERYDLSPACRVRAGTTDSIAAFLASGAQEPGQAVTSLGSTLVLKLLSRQRVEDRASGIYSHRLGNLWLVGGASNTGGAVLQHLFPEGILQRLSSQLRPDQPTGLDYYPLLRPGERFPINDPHYPPRLEPRPGDPVRFLQGVLEAIARIEAQGYAQLTDLGASALTQVWTAGGGAQNDGWTAIRQRMLPVPVAPAPQTEAAVGTARLALGLALTA
jgi:sugar (pentulose or hexulose) kinase